MANLNNLNVQLTVDVRPDMDVINVFVANSIWQKYMHDEGSIRMADQQHLTLSKLVAYMHDFIIARTLQVQKGAANERFRDFKFFQSLYLPVGFGPFVLNAIGRSKLDKAIYYTVTPKLAKDYTPSVDKLMDHDFVADEKDRLGKAFVLTKSQMVEISRSLMILNSISPVMTGQLSNKIDTQSPAIFTFMEQVSSDDLTFSGSREVRVMAHAVNIDDADLYAAMIVGFTQPMTAWKVLYPAYEMIPIERVSEMYQSTVPSNKDDDQTGKSSKFKGKKSKNAAKKES